MKSNDVQERLQREAEFHDHSFSHNVRERADKFYTVTRTSRDYYHRLIMEGVAGRRVLEYGCGTGSSAFEIAALGGHAVGIDISPVAIEMAEQEAWRLNVEANTEFMVMNAEELEFPDNSFDIICGTGILHHLDLGKSYGEIARVLKPGGRGIFSEPMGHNPLINWYRNRTPEMRTPDEHPLLMSDLKESRRYFSNVNARFYHLMSLGTVPFRSTPLFAPLYRLVEGIDRVAMTVIPPLKGWAWMVVLEFEK